jgi:hypothetical protein
MCKKKKNQKIVIINCTLKKELVFFKDYFSEAHRKIKLSKQLYEEGEKEVATIIPLLIIGGLSRIIYPKCKDRESFINTINKYSKNPFVLVKGNPEYLYSSFRCCLAHGNVFPVMFNKWYGENKGSYDISMVDDLGKTTVVYRSVSHSLVSNIANEIITNYKKSLPKKVNVFVQELYCCNNCNCIFLNTSNIVKCPFC